MAIALFSGPQDVSQLESLLNQLVTSVNGYVAGQGGSSGVISQVTAGTTSANLPTAGVVTLSSTVAGASYTLPNPTAAINGQTVSLVSISTKSQTVSGKFNKTHTKLTFKTTATGAMTGPAGQQACTLTALSSTAGWAITGMVGTLKSS